MNLFRFCLALFFAYALPMQADLVHQFSISNSPIVFEILQPENLVEDESNEVLFVLENQEEKKSQSIFHFFYGPNFPLNSFTELQSYVQWFATQAFPSEELSQWSIDSSSERALVSFLATDFEGNQKYSFIFVGKVQDELVFSATGVHPESFEGAKDVCKALLDNIFWNQP